jgi:hypothetical protein
MINTYNDFMTFGAGAVSGAVLSKSVKTIYKTLVFTSSLIITGREILYLAKKYPKTLGLATIALGVLFTSVYVYYMGELNE